MDRYARIVQGRVVDLTENAPTLAPGECARIVQCGEEVQIGWVWTPEGCAPETVYPWAETRERILSGLAAIDAASARPLRAILAAQASGGTADAADVARIADLEAQAVALRAELAGLEA